MLPGTLWTAKRKDWSAGGRLFIKRVFVTDKT